MRIEDKHVRRIVRGIVIHIVSTILLGILLMPIYLIIALLNSIQVPTILGTIILISMIPIFSYILGWVSEKTVKEWIE
jgi:hypothetical protein